MTEQKRIFDKNIERVKSICNLYTALKEEDRKDKSAYTLTDMLRAAVVLLHSSFEEYFRNTITQWLPLKADRKILEEIPLPKDLGKNNVKYSLYELLSYPQTLQELFDDAVSEYMGRKSFNNCKELYKWTKTVGMDISGFNNQSAFEAAVSRRHKIVHEADTNRTNSGERLTPIKPGDVISWISAYENLVEAIEKQVEEWEKTNGQTNI